MKGFKVSDAKRSRTVGVACKSLKELIEKGKLKLKIPSTNSVSVFLPDGTEVESEEYFQLLPNQAVIILKQDNEEILTGAELIYSALRYVNLDLLRAGEKVKQFFDENVKEKVRVLADIINDKRITDDKTILSDKNDDPDWFVGLETNAKTKETFMFRRCQERIRGYLYKTKSDVQKSSLYLKDSGIRHVLNEVFSDFTKSLNKDKYFGCYFDRSDTGSLCDKHGQFKCSGVWKHNKCSYNGGKSHLINPYSSREERIVFSTWNLDHCVERSRSIIPALMNAAEFVVCSNENPTKVNMQYFYSLLFTSQNLRLVHIVCHDKGKHHSAQCDPKKFIIYVSSKGKSPQKTSELSSEVQPCLVDTN